MKVDIIKKFKWYIVGFILVAIMLSVSLSFCTWDTLSVKASIAAKGGDYAEKPTTKYVLTTDNNSNGIADVGDIVEYGRFYQDANAISTGETAPQRWIVVDYNITTKVATLLTEQVVVYGNYWGNSAYLNDYYRSTVRSWLNSGKGSLKGSGTTWKDNERYDDNKRNDGVNNNLAFNINASNQVNKGFLDVAFTDDEKSILIPKNVTGMKYLNTSNTSIPCVTNGTNSTTINDLVWLPSWKEIYGTSNAPTGDTSINNETHFEHYADNIANSFKVSGASEYAWNAASSSYYNNGGGSVNGTKAATWWWLRSPLPTNYTYALMVNTGGSGNNARTSNSGGGVRPAVCVQL